MPPLSEAVQAMVDSIGPTASLDEFVAAYEKDDNLWWRIACGHQQNLFEAALDAYDEQRAEVKRLRRWKAEAVPVMDGLQDLGRALGLPLGERITGPAALAEVERLRAKVADAWDEGVATALNHAIRNDDGITLRLEHLDGRPWVNPYRAELASKGGDHAVE